MPDRRKGAGQGPLGPCPNCGSDTGPFMHDESNVHQVVCSTCGMRGPYDNFVSTATEQWNDLPSKSQREYVYGMVIKLWSESYAGGHSGTALIKDIHPTVAGHTWDDLINGKAYPHDENESIIRGRGTGGPELHSGGSV